MSEITRQEFETKYAKDSGVTVEYLRAMGRIAIPCHCGGGVCPGWQMRHWATMDNCEIQSIPEPYKTEIEYRRNDIDRVVNEHG